MARSGRCRAGSTAGARREYGTGYSRRFSRKPRNATRWTGACISWMPLSFAPINTPPAHAGPAPSGGEGEALGRSQGGFSTKLHLRAEGNGRPITAVLTGGERQEQIALERLLDQGAIRRPGRGRPRLRPLKVAGDKAYSGLSGISCGVGHDGSEEAHPCRDAKNLTSRMPCSISCWPAPIRELPWRPMGCLTI